MNLAQIFTQEYSKFIADYNKSCLEQINALLLSQPDAICHIVITGKTSADIPIELELKINDEQWKELTAIKLRLESQLTIDNARKRKVHDDSLLPPTNRWSVRRSHGEPRVGTARPVVTVSAPEADPPGSSARRP